ncbi:unannotated protein [freshwater metagenome]|uniref:Unannotated protein n=1 Tax=freshwater metagenome TaxID=449393 RepID=A0A6J6QN72_9ZZZZ
MKHVRKMTLLVAATAMTAGLVSIGAPAQADTSWGCGGYCGSRK